MELKEKLRQILKERYGIENDAEIIKEARTLHQKRRLSAYRPKRYLRSSSEPGSTKGKSLYSWNYSE